MRQDHLYPDKNRERSRQFPINGGINEFSKFIRRAIDSILFSSVWAWVILNYPKQYLLYLNLSRKKGALPLPVLPRNANDKFFWRKVFDHDPRFPIISDKLAVKDWVRQEGIDVKTARVVWQGKDAHQIPHSLLDEPIVLKANHGWNMNIFIRGGEHNREGIIQTANSFLNKTHGEQTGEWGYRDIPRCLFAEEMLGKGDKEVFELKFYTFGDKLGRLIVIYDRYGDAAADVWMPDEDGTFRLTEETTAVTEKRAGRPLPRSSKHAEEIAREIGSRFDHMRVDLFTDSQEIWLSELTIYNLGGHMMDYGHDPDSPLNTVWDLRRSWFLSTPQRGWRRMYANALRRKINHTHRG